MGLPTSAGLMFMAKPGPELAEIRRFVNLQTIHGLFGQWHAVLKKVPGVYQDPPIEQQPADGKAKSPLGTW